jgi:hypothetical protein
MNAPAELDATYYGFIGSTLDALILFEACITGQIKHVSRRPHDREREYVIQSGRIFIYEESTSGIKRWTDGISWSPSRILGNFLIYRQLVKAFGPGEKKKAIKKSKTGYNGPPKKGSRDGNGMKKDDYALDGSSPAISSASYGRAGAIDAETERALIGSLTDSYDFLDEGLVKKTISVTCDQVTHHLVSYYTIADVIGQKLLTPSKDPRFQNVHPRASLLTQQNFRSPIEDVDPMDRSLFLPPPGYDLSSSAMVQTPNTIFSGQTPPPAYLRTGVEMYNTTYSMPVAPTQFDNATPAYVSSSYGVSHAGNSGIVYPMGPPRPEQSSPEYQQSYMAVSGYQHDAGRGMMSTAPHLQPEPASMFHRRDSEDSGVSMSLEKGGMSASYFEGPHGYYPMPRSIDLHQGGYDARKGLPVQSPPDYRRHPLPDRAESSAVNYRLGMPGNSREMWQVPQVGNVSVGHGHYQRA